MEWRVVGGEWSGEWRVESGGNWWRGGRWMVDEEVDGALVIV